MNNQAVVYGDAVESWAQRIRLDVARSAEAIITTGRTLIDCKGDLNHGEFLEATRRARVSPRVAQMFMAIAHHPALANTSSHSHLPAAYNTLYDLSRLEPFVLEAAIADGLVHPGITRTEVKTLVVAMSRLANTDTTASLTTDGALFRAIVVDPPWQYENTASRAAAENHYPTMTMDELAALEIPAFDDAHLYLWVTNSFIREGFALLDEWGFTHKTALTWIKPQMGMGNYFRSTTEHVLFATRGTLPTRRRDEVNSFRSDRLRHSQKPNCFYELVERSSPGPYLEMFARSHRVGWTAWGNEIGSAP